MKLKLPSLSWVTFDCYGTLIDWETGIKSFLTNLIACKSVKVNIDGLHRRWEEVQFDLIQSDYHPYKYILRLSLEATLKEFGISYSPEDGDAFSMSMPTWKPFLDVVPTLQELKRYVRIAIISNTDNDILRESVKLMSVDFDALITAEDAKVYKPSLRIFEFALQRLSEPPGQILHVAFGFKYDLIPAKQVGMLTCWLNRTGQKKPEEAVIDFTLTSLSQLTKFVQRINQTCQT